MSKEKRRVPKLRFPGFTEDWEQRKANYIFNSVTDKGYPELPVLSASQELGMVYRDQNGIDIQHDKKNETSYKRVLPGQFVIHLRSFQGGFAYSEVEGITSPAYTVMSFKNSSEQYGLFWKHVFKSETFIKRLETITYGIRDGRSISFSDFKSLILQYPSFSEQKLIGGSIEIIESGITLHQRKLDNLKLKKKALLQKLFPKNGERYPELRFPGFTDAWEQRKLGDVLISLQNNTLSRADLSFEQGIAKNVHYGDILVKFGEVIDVKTELLPMIVDEVIIAKYKSSFLQNGDVIVADTAEDETVGKCTEIAGLSDEIVISGLHTIPYRPLQKFASGYLGYYMNSAAFHNQLLPLMQGIKVTSISKTALQNTDILYPKSATEQAAIGKYFSRLDNLITLHQRKSQYYIRRIRKECLMI